MITVDELNKYLPFGKVLSSRRVVLRDYPHSEGTVFRLSSRSDELFISDTINRMCFHSAYHILYKGHPFKDRCYYVTDSLVIPINRGILV